MSEVINTSNLVNVIPSALTTLIVLAFSMGFLLGEGGSKFDEAVKYGSGKELYDSLPPLTQSVVNYLLNVTHHFQYGLLSIYVGWTYLSGDAQTLAWYFGWGLVISDLKDFENILVRLGLKQRPSEVTPP